jgi:1-acyl-sn-glycerol-3-phosphate acyltransferase
MKRTSAPASASGNFYHFIGKYGLKLFGWRVVGEVPKEPKFVIIASPHTSNWDFMLMMGVAFSLKVKLSWLGKDSLFKGWRGPILRWMGGIAIDRKASHNMVQQVAEQIGKKEKVALAIPPEATRKKTDHWKTGFYYIAREAHIPIVLGFVDYKRKLTGLGPTITPTGDIEADMVAIREFYKDKTAKYPEKVSEPNIRPHDK